MRNNKKRLQLRKVYSFVVDGKCELWYLQMLKQHEALNINIEPKLLQNKKLREQFELVKKLAEDSDKVFWIIDFDTIEKERQETKKGAISPLEKFKELYNKAINIKDKNIVIIVNNPCLEY